MPIFPRAASAGLKRRSIVATAPVLPRRRWHPAGLHKKAHPPVRGWSSERLCSYVWGSKRPPEDNNFRTRVGAALNLTQQQEQPCN